MKPMDRPLAVEFFRQLQLFSERVLALWDLPTTGSPWGHDPMAPPKGAVIHYTVSNTIRSTVGWFCDPAHKAHASAHVVVSPIAEPSLAHLAVDLPLMRSMPATVVQCRAPTQEAWHATWCNSTCYGIENVNVGQLARTTNQGYSSTDGRVPYTGIALQLFGRLWARFPDAQCRSNARILSMLQGLFGTVQPAWVLGHEQVQSMHTHDAGGYDKRDPGPAFPLAAVRAEGLSTGIDGGQITQALADLWRCGLNRGAPRQLEVDFVLMEICEGSAALDTSTCKELLSQLGYVVSSGPTLLSGDLVAVSQLQRCMGISPDGALTDETVAALRARYLDRFNG